MKDALIVGEEGRPGVEVGVNPWPSDHRALLATLEIAPAAVPALVTAWPARVTRGEELRVRARGVSGDGARVVIAPSGTDPRTLSAARPASPADMTLSTTEIEPGPHEASLLDSTGRLVSTASFWVAEKTARPTVEVGRARVRVGEAIEVRWREAPGNRWDWVGVYAEGVKPEAEGQPLLWRHTRATVAGATRLDGTAEGDGWPLRPGAYRVHLFEDDAYEPQAEARLVVEP